MEREEFRCHADECLRMADISRDPADKAAWLRLAQVWLRGPVKAGRRDQAQIPACSPT